MKVVIMETLSRVVEAETVAEVAEKYEAGEIVLNADDFISVFIKEARDGENG